MDKVIVSTKGNKYKISINGDNFTLLKEGIGDVIFNNEEDCFVLKFKELEMPNLSFSISENGNYTVDFNASITIPQQSIVVSNNEAILTIPVGVYTIYSITFESSSCVKTHTTPIEINCPTVPFCNCSGSNGGNFEITSIVNVTGNFYNISFNACNVNPFDWKIKNEAGTVVKEGTLVPTSSVVTINLIGLVNGNYLLEASSTGCQGTASKTFSINKDVVIPSFNNEKVEMEGLKISNNNGFISDTSNYFISNEYRPFYFVNEFFIGTEMNNYDLTSLIGIPIMLRKLVVKKSVFPSYQDLLTKGYFANIPDVNQNILSNSQTFLIV